MTALFPESWNAGALPDLPNTVHGIKSRDPWVVQCDDCLTKFESEHLILAAMQARFSTALPGYRLCDGCWAERGFVNTGGGWRRP